MNDDRAFGERLLRLAMLAHPPAFRARYLDEMLTYYRQACHAGKGWSWRARFLTASVRRIWGSPAPTPLPIIDAARRANVDYRARTLILALISALSVPLTLVGVAGALSHATRQRTREIAIELALGAEPRTVRRRVVRHAVTAAAIAIATGVAAGIGIGRLMSTTLFGVVSADPISIAATATLMLIVAWLAAFVPARRASSTSPIEALRE